MDSVRSYSVAAPSPWAGRVAWRQLCQSVVGDVSLDWSFLRRGALGFWRDGKRYKERKLAKGRAERTAFYVSKREKDGKGAAPASSFAAANALAEGLHDEDCNIRDPAPVANVIWSPVHHRDAAGASPLRTCFKEVRFDMLASSAKWLEKVRRKEKAMDSCRC